MVNIISALGGGNPVKAQKFIFNNDDVSATLNWKLYDSKGKESDIMFQSIVVRTVASNTSEVW